MSNDTIQKTCSSMFDAANNGLVSWKDLFEREQVIDPETARALIMYLLEVNDDNPREVGDRMEDLADYFLVSSGIFAKTDRNQQNRIHELDHYAEFSPHVEKYVTSTLNTTNSAFRFLGESKNLKGKLNVDKIYKTEGLKFLLDIPVGCYFTREGVKGDESRSAKAVLIEYQMKTKQLSITFTNDDWEFLLDNPLKFNALFYEKISLAKNVFDTKIADYDSI